jgi:hypothetical protein
MREGLSSAQPAFAMPAAYVNRHTAFAGPPGHHLNSSEMIEIIWKSCAIVLNEHDQAS